MPRSFSDLTEQEILALAIGAEEDDSRITGVLPHGFRTVSRNGQDPARDAAGRAWTCHRLMENYKASYGEHVLLIRREDVKGFLKRKPLWLSRLLTIDQVRKEVASMEYEARNFYESPPGARLIFPCVSFFQRTGSCRGNAMRRWRLILKMNSPLPGHSLSRRRRNGGCSFSSSSSRTGGTHGWIGFQRWLLFFAAAFCHAF